MVLSVEKSDPEPPLISIEEEAPAPPIPIPERRRTVSVKAVRASKGLANEAPAAEDFGGPDSRDEDRAAREVGDDGGNNGDADLSTGGIIGQAFAESNRDLSGHGDGLVPKGALAHSQTGNSDGARGLPVDGDHISASGQLGVSVPREISGERSTAPVFPSSAANTVGVTHQSSCFVVASRPTGVRAPERSFGLVAVDSGVARRGRMSHGIDGQAAISGPENVGCGAVIQQRQLIGAKVIQAEPVLRSLIHDYVDHLINENHHRICIPQTVEFGAIGGRGWIEYNPQQPPSFEEYQLVINPAPSPTDFPTSQFQQVSRYVFVV